MEKIEKIKQLIQSLKYELEKIEANPNTEPYLSGIAERCLRIELGYQDLESLEESVSEELQERIEDLRREEPDLGPESLRDRAVDFIPEIADGATPIYHWEIGILFFLYSEELEAAYQEAGVYEQRPENYQQVCIYFYLERFLYDELNSLIDE